jgi:hypothetical protein
MTRTDEGRSNHVGKIVRDRRCDAAGVRRITVRDARRTCVSLLADPDAHPRVADTVVSSAATRDALKRLGNALDR